MIEEPHQRRISDIKLRDPSGVAELTITGRGPELFVRWYERLDTRVIFETVIRADLAASRIIHADYRWDEFSANTVRVSETSRTLESLEKIRKQVDSCPGHHQEEMDLLRQLVEAIQAEKLKYIVKGSDRLQILEEFTKLVDVESSEEHVHKFFERNASIIDCLRSRWQSLYGVSAILSKFPIAPDRIPDFTLVDIQSYSTGSNLPDTITFVELKRPGAKLFVDHGRMSRELNDAWSESLDSLRIVGTAYDDYIRRLQKAAPIQQERLCRGTFRPEMECVIVIGRRGTLEGEEIDRTRALATSTKNAVRVITYDSLRELLETHLEDEQHPRQITALHGGSMVVF